MEARVRWIEDKRFLGEGDSGHGVVVDASTEKLGSSPMELLLIGTAGCTAYDVLSILQKKRQKVTALEVRAQGTRADSPPRVYTEIQLEYVVRGVDVKPDDVEEAIRLSKEKYCSASIMMGKTAVLHTTFRIERD
jgi:putative redox protein